MHTQSPPPGPWEFTALPLRLPDERILTARRNPLSMMTGRIRRHQETSSPSLHEGASSSRKTGRQGVRESGSQECQASGDIWRVLASPGDSGKSWRFLEIPGHSKDGCSSFHLSPCTPLISHSSPSHLPLISQSNDDLAAIPLHSLVTTLTTELCLELPRVACTVVPPVSQWTITLTLSLLPGLPGLQGRASPSPGRGSGRSVPVGDLCLGNPR